MKAMQYRGHRLDSLPTHRNRRAWSDHVFVRATTWVFSVVGLGTAPWSAIAQQVTFATDVSAQTTWTDNSGLQVAAVAVEDVMTEITPNLSVLAVSKRFRLTGDVGATAVNFLNETQRDRVVPRVRLVGSLEAIERLLFLDASVSTSQLVENPFGGRAEGASTVNSFTTTTYVVSPYIDWRMSPRARLLMRSDNTRTEARGSTDPISDGALSRQQVRLDVLPQPMGLTIEAERIDSRFSGLSQDTLLQKIARAIVSYAPSPEWVLNLRGGYEENLFGGLSRVNESIYGGGFEWRPTERTAVRGVGEHRFFGSGWDAVFSHRMPWLAWDLRTARVLSTSPQGLLTLASGGNVISLLDAILTTRYPDPVERARVVQDLIRRQGLPTSIGGPLTIYTQQAFISTGRSITLGLLGLTNTLSFTAGYLRIEGVFSDAIVQSPAGVGNSEQLASAMTYARRLSPFSAISLTAGRTYIRSLGNIAIAETRQQALRLVFTHQLSSRGEVLVGASRQLSVSANQVDYTENGAFVGFSKRF